MPCIRTISIDTLGNCVMKRHVVVVSIALVLVISIAGRVCGDDDAAQRLKVFLLAGQSNMEGQAVVDLDR